MVMQQVRSCAVAGILLASLSWSPAAAQETEPVGCDEEGGQLCLGGTRFALSVTWRDRQGGEGVGFPSTLTADTGTFWFFDEDNIELVVKVLNACVINDRFWVFAGGLTDVEVELTVVDTTTGQQQIYVNPLGEPFQPITDTAAFASCDAEAGTIPVSSTGLPLR